MRNRRSTGNDLDGSGGYAIDNQTALAINAKNNWWGAAITQEMTTGANPKNLIKIYDSYDDSNKGFVNYGGWLDGTALDPDNPPSAIQMGGHRDPYQIGQGGNDDVPSGDKVYISLKDSDRNGNSGAVDEVKVLITTETENSGTKGECWGCDSWEWEPGGRNADGDQNWIRHQDRGLDVDVWNVGEEIRSSR